MQMKERNVPRCGGNNMQVVLITDWLIALLMISIMTLFDWDGWLPNANEFVAINLCVCVCVWIVRDQHSIDLKSNCVRYVCVVHCALNCAEGPMRPPLPRIHRAVSVISDVCIRNHDIVNIGFRL